MLDCYVGIFDLQELNKRFLNEYFKKHLNYEDNFTIASQSIQFKLVHVLKKFLK